MVSTHGLCSQLVFGAGTNSQADQRLGLLMAEITHTHVFFCQALLFTMEAELSVLPMWLAAANSPQSGIVSDPHENRSKNCTNLASSQRRKVDAPVLQPCCRPGSHGRKRGNAYLRFSATRRSNADRERTGITEVLPNKFLGMMVARDGVEPPTPAFAVWR